MDVISSSEKARLPREAADTAETSGVAASAVAADSAPPWITPPAATEAIAAAIIVRTRTERRPCCDDDALGRTRDIGSLRILTSFCDVANKVLS